MGANPQLDFEEGMGVYYVVQCTKVYSIRPPRRKASLALQQLSQTLPSSYTDSDVQPYQASKRGIMKDAELAFVARASDRAALAPTCYRRAP